MDEGVLCAVELLLGLIIGCHAKKTIHVLFYSCTIALKFLINILKKLTSIYVRMSKVIFDCNN